jgi:hypothetical protein
MQVDDCREPDQRSPSSPVRASLQLEFSALGLLISQPEHQSREGDDSTAIFFNTTRRDLMPYFHVFPCSESSSLFSILPQTPLISVAIFSCRESTILLGTRAEHHICNTIVAASFGSECNAIRRRRMFRATISKSLSLMIT